MNSSYGSFLCLLGILLHPSVAPCAGLELKAEVVEAMEGGPFVLKAILTNRGETPIEIEQLPLSRSNASFEVGKGWKDRLVVPLDFEIIMGRRPTNRRVTLRAGQSLEETFFLHHRLIDIPAKKVNVGVKWYIGDTRDAKGAAVAAPSVVVPVDILPATPANVEGFRKRLEERVRAAEKTPPPKPPSYMLIYTKHPALVPLACRMLAERGPIDLFSGLSDPFPLLIEFVHEYAKPGERDRLFVDLVERMCWENRRFVFVYWENRRIELAAKELRRLQDSKDIWLRVWTYSAFHAQYTPAEARSLLVAVREQTTPLPAARLDSLLARIDDDDFAVRQRAGDELMRLRTRFAGRLGRLRAADLSPEVRSRVRAASERLEADRRDSPAASALCSLDPARPADRAVLLALAGGDPDCWLTVEAKKTLSRDEKATHAGSR